MIGRFVVLYFRIVNIAVTIMVTMFCVRYLSQTQCSWVCFTNLSYWALIFIKIIARPPSLNLYKSNSALKWGLAKMWLFKRGSGATLSTFTIFIFSPFYDWENQRIFPLGSNFFLLYLFIHSGSTKTHFLMLSDDAIFFLFNVLLYPKPTQMWRVRHTK